jgi:TetR/AcrR family transcriptional repressor of nem operon
MALDLTNRSTILPRMSNHPDSYFRILEAARDLIYGSSYADVGVQAICEKAHVQKGSFYHFFKSKQELTLAVIDNFFEGFKEGIIKEAFDPALAPSQRFKRLFQLAIERQQTLHEQTGHILGCPFGNLATEMATSDEVIRCKIDGLFDKLQGLIRDTLQEAIDKGEMEDMNVDATAEAMLAYFEGLMLLAKTRNDPGVLRELLPTIINIRIPKKH